MNFTKDAISGQEGFDWLSKIVEIDPDAVVSYGIDTRQGPQQTWNGTYTGYYLRKANEISSQRLQ